MVVLYFHLQPSVAVPLVPGGRPFLFWNAREVAREDWFVAAQAVLGILATRSTPLP